MTEKYKTYRLVGFGKFKRSKREPIFREKHPKPKRKGRKSRKLQKLFFGNLFKWVILILNGINVRLGDICSKNDIGEINLKGVINEADIWIRVYF